MGLHERAQEVLASAYCAGARTARQLDWSRPEFRGGAIYLHLVLNCQMQGEISPRQYRSYIARTIRYTHDGHRREVRTSLAVHFATGGARSPWMNPTNRNGRTGTFESPEEVLVTKKASGEVIQTLSFLLTPIFRLHK